MPKMPLDYTRLMSLPPREGVSQVVARDVILYALAVGATDSNLRFVYERDLQVLPTMATLLADDGFWLMDPQYRLNWVQILHGEQGLTMHAPLPASGAVRCVQRIDSVHDKGADKGAVLLASKELYNAASGQLLATLRATWILRGDGGFGGERGQLPAAHKVPADRAPDLVIDAATSSQQALLYRLSGDRNPLHVDPAVAREGGFERPILHGLCTYGFVGRALLAALCGDDITRFRRFDARFSNPVSPGETIRTEIWRDCAGLASVRARAIERDVVVIDNGRFEYS
jgi:acyl dehydratase